MGAVEYHVVQPGESTLDVAQKYGMRKKAVLVKNRMARNEELRAGRLLWLRHVRPREVAVEYRSLPESVGLERPLLATRSAPDDNAAQAVEVAPNAPGKSPAKRRSADAEDGWGEALPSRNAPAAAAQAPMPTSSPAPMPAPVTLLPSAPALIRTAASVPTKVASQLPPPAAPPAPAPLADEPRETEPAAEMAVEAPVASPTAGVPAPELEPVPEPAKNELSAAPRPMVVMPAPVAAPAALPVTHRVAPHESVYSIARLYQMAPATLMAINNLTLPANLLIGQMLLLKSPEATPMAVSVPVAPARAASGASRTNPAVYAPTPVVAQAPAPVPGGFAVQHTVAKGETLFSISRLYKVKVADLQAWNGKLDGNVKIGEVLRVQASTK